MTARHAIEQAVLEIAFDSEEEAFARQASLSQFMTRRLLPVIDDVFSALSPGETILRIDHLEIDLGAIRSVDFEAEMVKRLRLHLEEVLHQKVHSLPSGSSPAIIRISPSRADLELVERFLLTGQMPWHGTMGQNRTIDQVLHQVIRSEGRQLVALLQRSKPNANVIQRLVSQFSASLLADLVGLLAPSHKELLLRLMQDILTIRRQRRLFTTIPERDLIRVMWEGLIAGLLSRDDADIEPGHLLGGILRRIVRNREQTVTLLLPRLAEEARRLKRRSGQGRELADLVQLLRGQIRKERKAVARQEASGRMRLDHKGAQRETDLRFDGQTVTPYPSAGPADLDRWRELVVAALQRGDSSALADEWSWRLRAEPGRLREIIRREGQRAEIRRRLAQGWPEPMLRDIVGLFEPDGQAEIEAVVGGSELHQPIPGVPKPTPERFRRHLYEFTFTYLLVERGGKFNKRSYIGSLIRQMAAHDNLSAHELLEAFTQQLNLVTATTELGHELRELLNELTVEWRLRPSVPAETAWRSQVVISAYDRADELRACLSEGVGTDHSGLLATLSDSLIQNAPWQLLNLARDLQKDDLTLVRRVASLSVGAWRSLFEILLARLAPAQVEKWLRGFDQHADGGRALPRFCGALLERLILGQSFNLEALFSESAVSAGKDDHATSVTFTQAPSLGPSLLPTATGPQEHGLSLTETEWMDVLRGPGPFPVEEEVRIMAFLDHVPAVALKRLRLSIASLFEKGERAALLIDRLPERLLTRLLYVLRPVEHAQAQRVVDLLSMAGAGGEWTTDLAGLRRLAWRLLFSYLIEEGRPFALGRFVDRFVAALAQQISQPDLASVRARLHLHLTRQILPANPIDQRTLAALSRKGEEEPRPSMILKPVDQASKKEQDYTEQIYIANAGLVLASVYLPRLFAILGLTERNAFRDRRAAERAVHLLQFIVDERVDAPEYQLVLNKILCGVKTGAPIDRSIVISTDERQAIESLLHGMIQHWNVVGNTSLAGLRESFLQREGRLQLRDNAWHLLVESRAFDMLLDQLPWSFSTIKYSWMDRVLYVEWR